MSLYPKPRKGTNTTPNNYATAVDNLIRSNTSFAQAVSKTTNNSRNPQQMAAPSNTRRNPAIFSQKQTNQIVTPTPQLIMLPLKETHLRPKNNINIPNYICYRNDRDTDENGVRRYFNSHQAPTATVRFFGDLNATHNEWNCSVNSTRGKQLKTFTDTLNLTIAYPNSPTRFGYGTSNTLDIAVINNFNFPFTIDSIPELSSDHNPVFLNFPFITPIHSDNVRAVTTCWSDFRNNLKIPFDCLVSRAFEIPMCWKKKYLFSPPPYAPPTIKRLSQ
ncbi:putative RNA-directed DNA polymerase from transposon BS [Trichonephila clavipes]|nr:putative RNA-directed DNA polymerase from transposon BS [Trichonephila clavipes]